MIKSDEVMTFLAFQSVSTFKIYARLALKKWVKVVTSSLLQFFTREVTIFVGNFLPPTGDTNFCCSAWCVKKETV